MSDLVAENLENLVSVREAASICGVAVSTVHGWVQRGYLDASDVDASGHRLFKLIDVLKAARETRRRAVGDSRIA